MDDEKRAARGVVDVQVIRRGGMNYDKMSAIIFAQLSHIRVVDLLVKEWEELPAQLRMGISTLCSEGNCSATVSKNIQRLNERLGGKVLSKVKQFEVTINRRVERRDGVSYETKRVNNAKLGAARKYGLLE